MDRLLRPKDVCMILSIGKTTLYKYIKAGIIPKPVKWGQRISYWRSSEIEKLIDKIINGGELCG